MRSTTLKINDGECIGEVVINLPTYLERLEYVKEFNLEVKDGELVEASSKQIETFIKMVKIAQKHVASVDMKHTTSNLHITSYTDMMDYSEFDRIHATIATAVINGVKVGND